MTIVYEWAVEELDGLDPDADIIDVHHVSSYAEALAWQGRYDISRIVLIRDRPADFGYLDRSWAYVEDGKLPERFTYHPESGVLVPAKFHNEVRRAG